MSFFNDTATTGIYTLSLHGALPIFFVWSVHAPGAESVVLQGLEDSIVVEREGRLLVCKLSEEQRIKDFRK